MSKQQKTVRRSGRILKATLLLYAMSLFLSKLLGFSLIYAAPMAFPRDIIPTKPGRLNTVLLALIDEISHQQTTVIAIQRELVIRPALNPKDQGWGEDERALWIESRLRREGFSTISRLDLPDERVPSKVRPNLIIKYPETAVDPSTSTLWLIARLDTRPPDEIDGWEGSPYALRVDGDFLHGSGVEKNNMGITTCLLLLETLKQQNVNPPTRLGVIFPAADEDNKELGFRYILEQRPELFSPNDFFILLDYGNADGSAIDIADKSHLSFKISINGGSKYLYDSVNPALVGIELTRALDSLDKDFPQQNKLFLDPGNSFSLKRADETGNTVKYLPNQLSFNLDISLLPSSNIDAVEKYVRNKVEEIGRKQGVRISVEQKAAVASAPPSSATSHLVEQLQKAIELQLGVKASVVGANEPTLANFLRSKKLNAVAWSLYHRKDGIKTENISISAHLEQAQVLLRLLFLLFDPTEEQNLTKKKIGREQRLP